MGPSPLSTDDGIQSLVHATSLLLLTVSLPLCILRQGFAKLYSLALNLLYNRGSTWLCDLYLSLWSSWCWRLVTMPSFHLGFEILWLGKKPCWDKILKKGNKTEFGRGERSIWPYLKVRQTQLSGPGHCRYRVGPGGSCVQGVRVTGALFSSLFLESGPPIEGWVESLFASSTRRPVCPKALRRAVFPKRL